MLPSALVGLCFSSALSAQTAPPTGNFPPLETAPDSAGSPAVPSASPSDSAPVAPPTGTPPGPAAPPAEPPLPPGATGGAPGVPSSEPPPPPQKPRAGFEMPSFSVRIDPLTWIIEGQLGVEVEVELAKFLSVELVPLFVTAESPPAVPDAITQSSNGIGALAGGTLGVGFWPGGKPLRGTVLRVILRNAGYTYASRDDAGTLYDELSHTERHLYGFIGSHSVWGIFTIAGGFGLGVDLDRERRCFENEDVASPTSNCRRDELLLANPNDPRPWDLHGWLHPVQYMARLSLGVTF